MGNKQVWVAFLNVDLILSVKRFCFLFKNVEPFLIF